MAIIMVICFVSEFIFFLSQNERLRARHGIVISLYAGVELFCVCMDYRCSCALGFESLLSDWPQRLPLIRCNESLHEPFCNLFILVCIIKLPNEKASEYFYVCWSDKIKNTGVLTNKLCITV